MKYLPALCLALVALIAAGCSSDPDDQAFFGSGWRHPEEGANKRLQTVQTLTPLQNEFDRSPLNEAQRQAARSSAPTATPAPLTPD